MMLLILQMLRQGWRPLSELWREGGVEEEVFAHRNKAYGAYELRRNEGWYLLTALSMVVGGLISLGWISTQISFADAEDDYQVRMVQLCKGFEKAVLPPPPPCPPPSHHHVSWQMPVPAPLDEVLAARSIYGLGQMPVSKIEPESRPEAFLHAGAVEISSHPIEISELAPPLDWLIPEISETEADIPDIIQEEMPDIGSFVIGPDEPKPLNLSEIIKLVEIPQIARDAGLSGPIVFRVLIGKDGHYKRHQVVTGHPILVREIERHLPLLRFTPALEGDKPIKYWVNIPFNFKLID
ncbi:MAG: energy transducer TonB [Bacteroidota bacterium]